MLRAPEVEMTERQYRRTKRNQLKQAIQILKNLSEDSQYLPKPAIRSINKAVDSIDIARSELIPWWGKY